MSEIQTALKYNIKKTGFNQACESWLEDQAPAQTASSHHSAFFLPSSQRVITLQRGSERYMWKADDEERNLKSRLLKDFILSLPSDPYSEESEYL